MLKPNQYLIAMCFFIFSFSFLHLYFSTLSSSTQSVGANNSVSNTSGNSNSSLSSPSIGLTNTKVTNSTAKSTGGGNVVSNIPMVSQYIPTGMPFYQQPVYSYEDIQMLQQRIPPHVVSPFAKTNKQSKHTQKNSHVSISNPKINKNYQEFSTHTYTHQNFIFNHSSFNNTLYLFTHQNVHCILVHTVIHFGDIFNLSEIIFYLHISTRSK